ncbi:hypothetical protein, partial [Kitasatospora putterlickiae]|uniref:hypothetical protein n=1 Tax=Kitasatospora putterlickiae TaxID=221725 RepID=UPI0031CF311F
RLPLLGTAVRTAETLALYGGLDAAVPVTPLLGSAAPDGLGLGADGPAHWHLPAPRPRVSR